MRILLDVDGVIADFEGWAHEIALRLWPNRQLKVQVPEAWGFRERYRLSNAEFWQLELELARASARTMQLIPGALNGVQYLAHHHEVFFVTAPYKINRSWEADRRDWLHHYFGRAAMKRVVSTSCKYLVSGDVLIDDRIDNLWAWSADHPGGRCVWFRREDTVPHWYNRGQIDLVHDWSEVRKAIGRL
jgi:5'(3')-deoxyribonucleotidase